MKATFSLILLITFCIVYKTPVMAQKIIAELGEVTAENKILGHYFLYGTHKGKEIQGHAKGMSIRILENKKKVVEKKVSFKTKEGTAFLNKVILKKDEIVTLSLVTSNKEEGIYLQTLSYDDLSPIKEPIKISGLEEVAKNCVPSLFRAKVSSMEVFFNEKNENISIVVTVEPNSDGARKFVEIINLDREYNVVGQPYVFYAENTKNKVLVSELLIYDEGMVAAVILEREEKYILGYTLTYMNLSDEEPLETKVSPAYNQIAGLKLSNNTFDGKFTFTILSVDSEEKTKGAITIYQYNIKKHTIDSESYGMNEDDLSKSKYEVLLSRYKVHESHFLDDGSNILTLSNSYNITNYRTDGSYDIDYFEKGFLILKINKDQKVEWVSEVKRNAAAGYYGAVDALIYYTEDGFMEIVFNTNEKQFETGSYNTEVGKAATFLSYKGTDSYKPTKATINMENGESSVKEMTFGNKKVRALTIDEFEKGNEPGVYTLKVELDKTPTLVKFDFK